MSEWNNKKLDTLCREVRKRYPWLPVLAILWIYSTNSERPVLGELGKVGSVSIAFSLCLRTPWLALRALSLAFWIAWIRLFLNPLLHSLRAQSFDVAAKTWVYPLAKETEGRDFYLGDLGEQLNRRGMKFLMVYGNATDRNWLRLVWARRGSGFPYQVPELCFLSPFIVFQMILRQTAAAALLFGKALFEKERDLKQLLLVVSRDCLRYLTLRNGLFYWIGKRVATYWKPKFFLILYEGNAWEKCLSLGIREMSPSCKMIGYQHTVIMEHALELRTPSNSIANLRPPEFILNTGSHPITLMQGGHESFGSRFVPFGTFRYPFSGNGILEPRPSQKTLLVSPEGISSEMIFLFNAAFDLATSLPDYQIVLRCHPVLPFHRMPQDLKRRLENCPNVILSESPSIEEDFHRSSVLLYRGSSSLIYAVLTGLKPFYLAKEFKEENRDPLFELSFWREKVSSVQELAQRIKAYSNIPKEKTMADWQKAFEYVQNYVQPVEPRSYERLVEVLQ